MMSQMLLVVVGPHDLASLTLRLIWYIFGRVYLFVYLKPVFIGKFAQVVTRAKFNFHTLDDFSFGEILYNWLKYRRQI